MGKCVLTNQINRNMEIYMQIDNIELSIVKIIVSSFRDPIDPFDLLVCQRM